MKTAKEIRSEIEDIVEQDDCYKWWGEVQDSFNVDDYKID